MLYHIFYHMQAMESTFIRVAVQTQNYMSVFSVLYLVKALHLVREVTALFVFGHDYAVLRKEFKLAYLSESLLVQFRFIWRIQYKDIYLFSYFFKIFYGIAAYTTAPSALQWSMFVFIIPMLVLELSKK